MDTWNVLTTATSSAITRDDMGSFRQKHKIVSFLPEISKFRNRFLFSKGKHWIVS